MTNRTPRRPTVGRGIVALRRGRAVKNVAVRRIRPWLALALLGLVAASASACGTTQQEAEQTGARSGEGDTTTAAATTGTTTRAAEPTETTLAAAPTAGRVAEQPTPTIEGGQADVETDAETDAETTGAALIAAAERGDEGAVRRILEEGADVSARDASGRTALVAAAYGNYLGAAEALIEAGADVNAKDQTVQSAYLISTAEVGDDPRLLELTLRNGADVGSLDSYNGTGLIRAADRGYVRIVERLLATETNVDHVNNLGWTALLEAIILGGGDAAHAEVVRLLVEGGADPNLPDGEGVTPLEHAEQRGYSGMAEILRGGY